MPFPHAQTYDYDLLGLRFENLGRRLAKTTLPRAADTSTAFKRLANYMGHIQTAPDDLYRGRGPSKVTKARSDRAMKRQRDQSVDHNKKEDIYRALMKNTDEQISTASEISMMRGYFFDYATKSAEQKEASIRRWEDIFHAITLARLPTSMTASDVKDGAIRERFAHPVGGKAVADIAGRHSMINQKGDASAPGHGEFDRQRATQVVQAGERALSQPDATVESVLVEMIHTANSYTLHHVEPPFAENVVEFTHGDAARTPVHRLREHFKHATNLLHHDAGGPPSSHNPFHQVHLPKTVRKVLPSQTSKTVGGSVRTRSPSPFRKVA